MNNKKVGGRQKSSLKPEELVEQRDSSNDLPYAEGDLVWGRCKDWNWWPAMVRGPFPNEQFLRGNKVFCQYIDSPPTKEWLPLTRMRPYERHGATENEIPRVDKTARWCAAVKYADEMAKTRNKAERLARYWIQENDIQYPGWDDKTGVSKSSSKPVASCKRANNTDKPGPLSKKRAP